MSKQEIMTKINHFQRIVDNTNSIYLKRDYIKHIKKLKKLLHKLD